MYLDKRIVLVSRTNVGKTASVRIIQRVDKSITPDGSQLKYHVADLLVENSSGEAVNRVIFGTQPGPHLFLFVVSIIDGYTKDDNEFADLFFRIFEDDVINFTAVLFTGADHLEANQTIDGYLQTACQHLRNLIEKCNNKYLAINNKEHSPDQVSDFVHKIYGIISKNNDAYYSNKCSKVLEKSMKQGEDIARMNKDIVSIQIILLNVIIWWFIYMLSYILLTGELL